MTNRILNIILLSAATLMGCFFVGCENKMADVQRMSTKAINVEEAINIESYVSNGGVVRARLTAPMFLRYQSEVPKVEFPKSLHVDFYDSTLKVESELFAKYGEYKESENIILLRDSVVVFNVKKDTLFTDELFWDQNRQIFFTDKPVVISQTTPQRQKIYGIGMTADQSLTRITINNLQRPSFTVVPDSTF